MRNKNVQISLFDIYNGMSQSMEEHNKPELIRLLEEHIDFDSLIPASFYLAFYSTSADDISIIWKAFSRR